MRRPTPRPIHLIIGFPPGGGVDIVARLMAQWLSVRLGQQVIVENKPGAGGNIATEIVVRAPPDGYTLTYVGPVAAINPSFTRISVSISYPTLRRSQASCVSLWCWSHAVARRQRPFPNSSVMPRPIQAKSIWRRPAARTRRRQGNPKKLFNGTRKRPGRNPGPSISVEGGLNSPCRPCHHQA